MTVKRCEGGTKIAVGGPRAAPAFSWTCSHRNRNRPTECNHKYRCRNCVRRVRDRSPQSEDRNAPPGRPGLASARLNPTNFRLPGANANSWRGITVLRLDDAHGMGDASRRFSLVTFLALPLMLGLFGTAIANIR
jgi:hypothetical protein